MIVYEQPLNERIRTFLRLEFLFAQAESSVNRESEWDSRATMTNLIDIVSTFGRSDLKAEVLKELERHAGSLTRHEANPNIDKRMLTQLLDQLDSLSDELHAISGQIGHGLRENEFLNTIRQRSSVPGGTCAFDLPGYHFWLQQPAADRTADLRRWLGQFDAIRTAILLILDLIRGSAVPTRETAASGFFHRSLDPNHPYQLIRVAVSEDYKCYPEVSGGKHRFTVRFLESPADTERPAQTSEDVEFALTCCLL